MSTENQVIVTAPVLVPGEQDCDYCNGESILTKEQVQKMAHKYLQNYRIVDQQHDFFKTQKSRGEVIESYIAKSETPITYLDGTTETVPEGTWIASTLITDPESISLAKKGKLKGYSVTALSSKDAEEYMKHISNKSRTLIKDLEDPVGFTISLVSNPCVPKANFCNVNKNCESDNMSNQDEQIESATQTFLNSIKSVFQSEHKSEDSVNYVTSEELEKVVGKMKEDILSELKPEQSSKSEEEQEESEEIDEQESASKSEEEQENNDKEESDKDKKIKELEAKIKELKSKSAGKSKGLNSHLEDNIQTAVKNLYEDTGRDCFGRVIKQ